MEREEKSKTARHKVFVRVVVVGGRDKVEGGRKGGGAGRGRRGEKVNISWTSVISDRNKKGEEVN